MKFWTAAVRVSTLALACIALLAACESDDPGPRRDLSLSDPELDPTEEAERLRRLQMIRVRHFDADTGEPLPGALEWSEETADNLGFLLAYECASSIQIPPTWGNCGLFDRAARLSLCVAHRLVDAAGLRAVPLRSGVVELIDFEIPEPSSAGRAALLRTALRIMNTGSEAFWTHTNNALNPLTGACWNHAGWPGNNDGGLDLSRDAPSLVAAMAEAYYLQREIYEKASDAILAYADYQRSHPSLKVGQERGLYGQLGPSGLPELSRSEAARLWVGGNVGLDTNFKFCTSAELTGASKTALFALRASGISPAAILGTTSTATLLDTGSATTGASVKARLARFWDQPSMANASSGSIVEQLGLVPSDFDAARAYLAQEIKAFSRSMVAQKDIDPGTGINNFTRWVATATEPVVLPNAYYAAVGGVNDTDEFGEVISGNLPGDGYAEFVDAIGSFITFIHSSAPFPSSPNPNTDPIRAGILNPLSLILADVGRSRPARFTYCRPGSPTTAGFRVDGFLNTEGKYALVGEDAVRCATTGNVEGAACTLRTSTFGTWDGNPPYWAVPLTTSASPMTGFGAAATGPLTQAIPANTRVYLAESFSAGAPGSFKVLGGGMTLKTSTGCTSAPVVPFAEEKAAKILAPSTKWCTHPTVECDGTVFDERLPLENELSDDQDGVESSWKHYLTLARNAADEADALAESYVSAGIQSEERGEENELREKANDIQMMEALNELQNICGTNVDPVVLMDLFKNLTLMSVDGFPACTTDAACTAINAETKCVGAKCIKDPVKVAAARLDKADADRLINCLGDERILSHVTLGDLPVCIWQLNGNPNQICQGYNDTTFKRADHPCPDFGQTIVNPTTGVKTYSCPPHITAPGGHTMLLPIDKMLEYFHPSEYSGGQPKTKEVCEDVRRLRKKVETGTIVSESGDPKFKSLSMLEHIRKSEFFHPSNLASVARRIGYTHGLGAFSAITVDGQPKYTTGDAWRGPETVKWPCSPANQTPVSCTDGSGSGLFCQTAVCAPAIPSPTAGNIDARVRMNELMYRAVVATRVLALDGLGGAITKPSWAVTAGGNGSWPSQVVGTRTRVGSAVPVTVIEFPNFNTARGYSVQSAVAADKFAWRQSNYGFSATKRSPISNVDLFVGMVDGSGFFDFGTNDVDLGCCWTNSVFLDPRPDQMTPPPPIEPVHTQWWDGLSSAPFKSGDWGYFYQLFRGQRRISDDVPGIDRWNPGSFDNPVLVGDRHAGSNHHVRPFNWEPADMLNAMELLCDVGMGSTPACDASKPPTVRSVDDLLNAKDYLDCVASAIGQHAGTAVLTKFPEDAFNALRQQSVVGAFPANGGEWGVQLQSLNAALVAISNVEPQITGEIRLLGHDLNSVRISLRRAGISKQMNDIQFMATMTDRMAECANAMMASALTVGVGAIVPCANALAQINFASQLNELQAEDNTLAKELEINNFGSVFSSRSQNLDRYARQFAEQIAIIDSSLARLEQLRGQARRALSKAIFMRTNVASNAMAINTAYRNRFNTARLRYEAALGNAKRLTFTAKRAIEQRLGVRLADMREDLPLVDAPANWEARICTAKGINFKEDVLKSDRLNADILNPNTNYADLYIGDYVTKLTNLVESYRMVHGFHEGTDTAVVSLRDDIQRVRAECEVPVDNLLKYSSTLDQPTVPESKGWDRLGCATTTSGGTTVPLPNCVDAFPTQSVGFQSREAEAGIPNVYQVFFGTGTADCGVTCGFRLADTALAQPVDLTTGKYILSWYADPAVAEFNVTPPQPWPAGAPGYVSVRGQNRVLIANTQVAAAMAEPTGLKRYHMIFSVTADQPGTIEIRAPGPGRSIKMGGFQLERADVPSPTGPKRYVETMGTNTRVMKVCEDTNGTEFRGTRWNRGCVNLCPDGFSGECDASQAKSYCYRETTFSINQRDIEDRRIFLSSGFARGNFNYRIESIAVNFVGSDTRDCSDMPTPQSCHGAGFIPFSLYHSGPFYVRNHMGDDVRAMLFDGRIEHARGLASERYLTNPLGSADTSLIEQYLRKEFQGRPLDGTFALRVWDEPGVNFDGIKDIQAVLKYRYWTKLN